MEADDVAFSSAAFIRVRDPCVELVQATDVRVEGPGLVGYGDGELIAAAPLRVHCEPAAVGIFVPV